MSTVVNAIVKDLDVHFDIEGLGFHIFKGELKLKITFSLTVLKTCSEQWRTVTFLTGCSLFRNTYHTPRPPDPRLSLQC